MKILELFSGYGTASFALKRLGIDYKLVGYSDIDKYANQCFKQNHCPNDFNDILRLGDITKVNPHSITDFDLLTGGFPCQAFSNAGKQLGELDPRGTLFYEIIRIAEVKKPRYMLLENVKGLTQKKFRGTFNKILSELDRIGYQVRWEVLNTKDYGIPQNRERVWFVCFRNDNDGRYPAKDFQFPEKEELNIFIKDILEPIVDDKYYLSELMQERFAKYLENKKQNANLIYDNHRVNEIRKYDGISFTLSQAMGTGGNNVPLVSSTLTTELAHSTGRDFFRSGQAEKILKSSGNLRRLTPKECFRLQGFLNDEVNLEGLSDTQKYKLAGNGQSVNVVEKIFRNMFKECEINGNITN
jgi:DNA (cytosine-5)-methyltransferase 1